MKIQKRIAPLLIAIFIGTIFLTGCTDITKSGKYQSYRLTYLINTTNAGQDVSTKTEDLKKVVLGRLHKFEVAKVSANLSLEDNRNYLVLEFGTTDDVQRIKAEIERSTSFELKRQFKDEEDYEDGLKAHAEEILESLKNGADFETTAQNAVLNDPARIFYVHSDNMYRDEVKDVFAEILFDMEPGQTSEELIEYKEQSSPLMPPIDIVSIAKLFDKKEVERITSYDKEVEVSHILIAYEGAMRAAESITRTKDEAFDLAEEIVSKLNEGGDFATLAKEYSDDASNSQSGGLLQMPAGQGIYVEQFENAALALEEDGQISPTTETTFGYHIIKANKVTPAREESNMEEQIEFGVLFYAMVKAEWENLDFDKSTLASIETRYDESYDPYLILKFNETGKETLREITQNSLEKVIGIFSGSQLITSFTVREVNKEGTIKVLKPATTKEADDLKELLLTKPLPLPIIFQEFELLEQDQ